MSALTLAKVDCIITVTTRNSIYSVIAPYQGRATIGGGIIGKPEAIRVLPLPIATAVDLARKGDVTRANEVLATHYLSLPLFVDSLQTSSVQEIHVRTQAITPTQAKVGANPFVPPVQVAVDLDEESMPRDLAVVFAKHPAFRSPVPVMSLTCTYCDTLVDLTKGDYDLDRICGNSNNGYEAAHNACVAAAKAKADAEYAAYCAEQDRLEVLADFCD